MLICVPHVNTLSVSRASVVIAAYSTLAGVIWVMEGTNIEAIFGHSPLQVFHAQNVLPKLAWGASPRDAARHADDNRGVIHLDFAVRACHGLFEVSQVEVAVFLELKVAQVATERFRVGLLKKLSDETNYIPFDPS